MQKTIPALTARQRYWLEHIQSWEASGTSMAEYAASKNIAVRAMYSGRKTLKLKGVLPATQPARFQRVQVMDTPVSGQWRIQLPNGVSVAFAGTVDTPTLTTVLRTAAALE